VNERTRRLARAAKPFVPNGFIEAYYAHRAFRRFRATAGHPWRAALNRQLRDLLEGSRLVYVPTAVVANPVCIVDVGAHVGAWARAVLKFLAPERLICIEPTPESHARLQRAVGADPRAKIIQCAVGAQSGTAQMHAFASSDFNSLLPLDLSLRQRYAHIGEERTIPVEVRRLDDLLADVPHVSLLKLDVQGYEMAVLDGARETLRRTGAVLVEVNFVPHYRGGVLFEELHRRMTEEFGFALHNLAPGTYGHDGRLIWTDAVYARELEG
jgi:FkbM family methyltransferase